MQGFWEKGLFCTLFMFSRFLLVSRDTAISICRIKKNGMKTQQKNFKIVKFEAIVCTKFSRNTLSKHVKEAISENCMQNLCYKNVMTCLRVTA